MPNHSSNQRSFSKKGVEQKGSDFFTPSCLRFTGRNQNAVKSLYRSIDFHRTAYRVLTVCVSQGGNPIKLRTHVMAERLYVQVLTGLEDTSKMGAGRAVDKRAVHLAKGKKAGGNPPQPPIKRKPARAKSVHLRRK